jgi:hypothetical protein
VSPPPLLLLPAPWPAPPCIAARARCCHRITGADHTALRCYYYRNRFTSWPTPNGAANGGAQHRLRPGMRARRRRGGKPTRPPSPITTTPYTSDPELAKTQGPATLIFYGMCLMTPLVLAGTWAPQGWTGERPLTAEHKSIGTVALAGAVAGFGMNCGIDRLCRSRASYIASSLRPRNIPFMCCVTCALVSQYPAPSIPCRALAPTYVHARMRAPWSCSCGRCCDLCVVAISMCSSSNSRNRRPLTHSRAHTCRWSVASQTWAPSTLCGDDKDV